MLIAVHLLQFLVWHFSQDFCVVYLCRPKVRNLLCFCACLDYRPYVISCIALFSFPVILSCWIFGLTVITCITTYCRVIYPSCHRGLSAIVLCIIPLPDLPLCSYIKYYCKLVLPPCICQQLGSFIIISIRIAIKTHIFFLFFFLNVI